MTLPSRIRSAIKYSATIAEVLEVKKTENANVRRDCATMAIAHQDNVDETDLNDLLECFMIYKSAIASLIRGLSPLPDAQKSPSQSDILAMLARQILSVLLKKDESNLLPRILSHFIGLASRGELRPLSTTLQCKTQIAGFVPRL
jgi:hypothetical protein